MKSPLVVIDVQDVFLNNLHNKEVYIDHVCDVVEKAKAQERLVMLVQYQGEGPTNIRVRKALAGYPHRTTVYKKHNGGAVEILNRLERLQPGTKSLTICGINLDCCVLETVQGLVWRGYICRIVREATCNSWIGFYEPADDDFTRRVWATSGHLLQPEVAKNVKLTDIRYFRYF